MALSLVCGAECGIVTTGLGTAASRHWDQILGAPAIETTVVRTGAKSFAFPAQAGGFCSLRRSPAAGTTVVYFRGYFRTTSAAPAIASQIVTLGVTGGAAQFIQISTAGVLKASAGGALQNGPTLSANTWYGVEAEFDCSANPARVRWRTWDAVNGWVSRTDATLAQAATVFPNVYFGLWGSTSAVTVYWDDVVWGEGTTLGADYDPAVSKGGQVKIYRPNADGTHSFTAADFGLDAAGADVSVGSTTVYQRLDESDQQDITDFIRQKVIRTTGYVEVGFEDEATLTPRAVAVTSTHHASGANANQQSVKVTDDAGSSLTTVWSNDDVSDATANFRHKVLTTKPSGGAWTRAALNSLVARLGYSGDVTDIPYWDSISLEVEFTDSTARSGAANSQATTSGASAAGAKQAKGSGSAATASGASATGGRQVAHGAPSQATTSGISGSGRKNALGASGTSSTVAGVAATGGPSGRLGSASAAVASAATVTGRSARRGAAGSIGVSTGVSAAGLAGEGGNAVVATVAGVTAIGRKAVSGIAQTTVASGAAASGRSARSGAAPSVPVSSGLAFGGHGNHSGAAATSAATGVSAEGLNSGPALGNNPSARPVRRGYGSTLTRRGTRASLELERSSSTGGFQSDSFQGDSFGGGTTTGGTMRATVTKR